MYFVAYFLGLFSFVSFSVCCDMTLGAAVCHASYEMNMLRKNRKRGRFIIIIIIIIIIFRPSVDMFPREFKN